MVRQSKKVATPRYKSQSANNGRSTGNSNGNNVDEPLFFYMPDAMHGELCQWFLSEFAMTKSQICQLLGSGQATTNTDSQDDGSISFNCAEQFMMYCKAARFNDIRSQRFILASPSPKEQKRLGKLVDGFTASSWDEVKDAVVLAGSMAKFTQNSKLRGKLLATGDRLLVEAASRDRIWGIGYTAKHAMQFRQHWGENRLGKALMEARDLLRKSQ